MRIYKLYAKSISRIFCHIFLAASLPGQRTCQPKNTSTRKNETAMGCNYILQLCHPPQPSYCLENRAPTTSEMIQHTVYQVAKETECNQPLCLRFQKAQDGYSLASRLFQLYRENYERANNQNLFSRKRFLALYKNLHLKSIELSPFWLSSPPSRARLKLEANPCCKPL